MRHRFMVRLRYSAYVFACVWLGIACGGCVRARAHTNEYVEYTGHETATVNQFVALPQSEPKYPNILDRLSLTLARRSYPPINARALTGNMAEALADIAAEHSPTSREALRSAWRAEALAGRTFESILNDPLWANDTNRRRGIAAAIETIPCASIWLIPPAEALAIRQLLEARGVSSNAATPAQLTVRMVQPDVLYIAIPTFEDGTVGRSVVEHISEALRHGSPAIILDLRNNPGGQPEQANAVADFFLDGQRLQTFLFADGRRLTFASHRGGAGAGKHVTILANRNTGSAAEMLMLALHDNDRAAVVGERTAGMLFGKDFVDLPDGRMIVFRTEPTILSPRGSDYSTTGIPPDIPVEDKASADVDPVLDAGVRHARKAMNKPKK